MENEENEEAKNMMMMLEKIPLAEFIDVLIDLYDKGADFVDLCGSPDKRQDGIQIIVRKEYISEDRESSDEDSPISDEFDTYIA